MPPPATFAAARARARSSSSHSLSPANSGERGYRAASVPFTPSTSRAALRQALSSSRNTATRAKASGCSAPAPPTASWPASQVSSCWQGTTWSRSRTVAPDGPREGTVPAAAASYLPLFRVRAWDLGSGLWCWASLLRVAGALSHRPPCHEAPPTPP